MTAFYEELVEDYSHDLFRYAYRFTGDRHVAEDLVAEAFTEAWRSLAKLRNRESARAWLYKIQRYRCLNWLRSKRRHPAPSASVEELEPFLAAEGERTLDAMERSEQLQRALDSLDDRYRESFLLVFMEGLSCKEAAEQLELPLGTVLSRIHRARTHLRERLSDFWEGQGNAVEHSKITPLRSAADSA
jgi:RNA polymerase sigma-70 factor (ECF subfamily)